MGSQSLRDQQRARKEDQPDAAVTSFASLLDAHPSFSGQLAHHV